MSGTATFSACGRYRYRLTRLWGDDGRRVATFILLNPSTADAEKDDPTIRRCIGFARGWGWDGLIIVNLFAWRSTDRSALRKVADPVGVENTDYILESAHFADRYGAPVVCAWGADGALYGRARVILDWLDVESIEPQCLRITKYGQPEHPLYLKSTLVPVPYIGRAQRQPS